jgi:hypothetical protein
MGPHPGPSAMPENYSIKHSGACLVVGYAPDVHSDVAAARALRPMAPLLGVKYAACLFPEIEHVWTQHLEQAADIRERAGRRIYVHGRPKAVQRKAAFHVFGKTDADLDFTWPSLAWVGASSGVAAAMWAKYGMGFDEVILCGVTLDPGGYAPGVRAFKKLRGNAGQSYVDTHSLYHWRDTVREFVRSGKAAGVRSMSGWTRETLGAPC